MMKKLKNLKNCEFFPRVAWGFRVFKDKLREKLGRNMGVEMDNCSTRDAHIEENFTQFLDPENWN